MLRTSLNMDYYHDLYDVATNFGVEVEAHRMLPSPFPFTPYLLAPHPLQRAHSARQRSSPSSLFARLPRHCSLAAARSQR